ncbi:4-pyridoxate dehydrogenase-like [Rhipicephalus sanguineus]|uniref:4-pyridoxate dehydrogenase-like n=1 Tax=Rhipicephalus sanguineus TaxID=34632 RepID=UPI0020C3E7E1|nr:4-pyridoxate dehydrogenase-like [Rhipicephalus sanguineus]
MQRALKGDWIGNVDAIQDSTTEELTALTKEAFVNCLQDLKKRWKLFGAGSAGCALANRLTADGSNSVLLLEAGGLEDAAVQVPFFSAVLQRTDIDWDYTSERQLSASLSVDGQDWGKKHKVEILEFRMENLGKLIYSIYRRLHGNINRLPRGKALGGSSSINHVIYARGNRKDYDNWASLYGAVGWSYNDVLPDFISIETSYLGIDNGVKYKRYLRTHSVRAKKEVILCAGAIASAQLLMLSGIGPREHLESFGVKNEGRPMKKPVLVLVSHLSHVLVPLVTLNPTTVEAGYLAGLIGISQIYESYYKRKQGDDVLMIVPILLRPNSSGFIRLKSTNPEEYPIIDPKFLTATSDLDTLIEGSRIAVQTLTTQAMRNGNVTIWDIALPACESAGPVWSEAYLRCFVQHTSLSGWHPCCTAPMGTHAQAVLDPRLRVLGGVKRLRVVDASSMPYLTTGNLNSPLMMMGHRAAAMIMEDNFQ